MKILAATALAGVLCAGGAAAQQIVDAADPDSILRVALGQGEAALFSDGYGDPFIEGRVGGRPYDVSFYGCTDNRDCRTVMFRAGFTGAGQTEAEMAGWNREQRFGKAYLDAAGNPTVEYNVNLEGGVTPANLESTFAIWKSVVARFAERFGY